MKPVADNSRQKSVILRTLSRNHSKKWYFIKVYHTGYIFQGYFQMSNFILCFWKFIWHHHPTTPKIHDISNEIFFTQDYIFGDIFKSHILSYAFDNSLDIITKQLQKSKISAIRYFFAHSHMFKDILECWILLLYFPATFYTLSRNHPKMSLRSKIRYLAAHKMASKKTLKRVANFVELF